MKIVSTTTNSNGHHIIDALSPEGFEYIFVFNENIKELTAYRRLFDVPFNTKQSCNSVREAKNIITQL